jgi:hypothetical protein
MNSTSRQSLVWFLGLVLVAGRAAGETPPDVKPQDIWRLVAGSHAIVIGTLHVPIGSVRTGLASNHHGCVGIDVACERNLKGTTRQSIRVYWSTRPGKHWPTPERVMAMDGKRAILFLIGFGEAETKSFYFAGDTPRALSDPEARLVEQVECEVAAQRDLLGRFDRLFPPEKEPLYSKVKGLIDATTRKETQMAAFRELEALGPRGVPAIIMLMDDRRKLAIEEISLENPPGHWEGSRLYGPKTVVDAMEAILNQITGESFAAIENGGTEKQRRKAVHGWRIYLYHLKKAGHDKK